MSIELNAAVTAREAETDRRARTRMLNECVRLRATWEDAVRDYELAQARVEVLKLGLAETQRET